MTRKLSVTGKYSIHKGIAEAVLDYATHLYSDQADQMVRNYGGSAISRIMMCVPYAFGKCWIHNSSMFINTRVRIKWNFLYRHFFLSLYVTM